MMACDICKILENKSEFKIIYEDELCFAMLHESPAVEGHTLVIPKKHATIIEELDDKAAGHLFAAANRVSTALFETFGAHGTNIILNNGLSAGQELPHVMLNVIPRKENDGLNFEWPAKRAENPELETSLSMIRTFSESIMAGKEAHIMKGPAPEPQPLRHEVIKHDAKEELKERIKEDDYLVKALKRMP